MFLKFMHRAQKKEIYINIGSIKSFVANGEYTRVTTVKEGVKTVDDFKIKIGDFAAQINEFYKPQITVHNKVGELEHTESRPFDPVFEANIALVAECAVLLDVINTQFPGTLKPCYSDEALVNLAHRLNGEDIAPIE